MQRLITISILALCSSSGPLFPSEGLFRFYVEEQWNRLVISSRSRVRLKQLLQGTTAAPFPSKTIPVALIPSSVVTSGGGGWVARGGHGSNNGGFVVFISPFPTESPVLEGTSSRRFLGRSFRFPRSSAGSHKETVQRIQPPETVSRQHWPRFLDKDGSFASSLSPPPGFLCGILRGIPRPTDPTLTGLNIIRSHGRAVVDVRG